MSVRTACLCCCLFLAAARAQGQDTGSGVSPFLQLKESRVSSANLLGMDRDGSGALPKKVMTDEPDTVRLVALRVAFTSDTDTLTTGAGTFDLSLDSDAVIDPPPHDYSYFERHLRALQHFYTAASHGRLVLVCDLYPADGEPSIVLDSTISFYTSGATAEQNDSLLAVFFQDAIRRADAAEPAIPLSTFDSFLIFHAGAGQESDLRRNSSRDIPSAFYSIRDLRRYLGGDDPSYQGIQIRDGYVREGWWLPETESQDGFELGLNGITAHLFGYQLGLPSLFNARTGKSGVGRWDLMDQGFENDSSRVPAQPCAWAKLFLGWAEAYEVRSSSESLAVAAWALDSGLTEIVKVPITPKEYFLIENRQKDAGGDGIHKTIEEGVVVAVDDYDWYLPGSGLLIWHIDEEVIAANYENNRVNADPRHRGVDLEEADGVQEIGTTYGYIYGQKNDAYFSGNTSWNEANHGLGLICFTSDSNPGSDSYSGARSHIQVTDISESGPVMNLKVSIDTYQSGWPQYMGSAAGANSPAFGDLDHNGDTEVIMASQVGQVFVWNHDASKFVNNSDSLPVVSIRGDTAWAQAAVFADAGDSVLCSPALGDLDGDDSLEVVVTSKGGRIWAWHPRDADANGQADLVAGFPVDLGAEIRSSVVIANLDPETPGMEMAVGTMDGRLFLIRAYLGTTLIADFGNDAIMGPPAIGGLDVDHIPEVEILPEIIVVTQGGRVRGFRSDGSDLGWDISMSGPVTSSPVVVDLDRDGTNEVVITGGSGEILTVDMDGVCRYNWPLQKADVFASSPALGDIDGDGYVEAVIAGQNGIYVFNYNGSELPGWPVTVSEDEVEAGMKGSPVIGDIDGDNDLEVLVGSPDGRLLAYHHDGHMVDGFPLTCGGDVLATPALLDVDTDGDIEVMVAAEDGYLYLWDLAGAYDTENLPWPTYAHDVQHTGAYPSYDIPPDVPQEELMAKGSVYNFPNPTEGNSTLIRYRLGEEASVRIRIFNLAGDLVDELSGPGEAHTENEISWDLADIASGVYLCRVEATGASGTKTVFCKIAVAK